MGVERKQVEKEFTRSAMPTVCEPGFIGSGASKKRAFDMNNVKQALPDAPVDESRMLQIIGRMQRVSMILKVET